MSSGDSICLCPSIHPSIHPFTHPRQHCQRPRPCSWLSMFVAVHGLTATQEGVGDCQWQPDDSIRPLGPRLGPEQTRTKDTTWTMHASGLRHDPPAPLSVSSMSTDRQTDRLTHPPLRLSSSACSTLTASGHGRDGLAELGKGREGKGNRLRRQ